MLDTTVDFWRDWLSAAKIPDHPWKPCLDHRALSLKELGYPHRDPPSVPAGPARWESSYHAPRT